MGIIGRIIAWLWRRWADYNSIIALLDILNWKTAIWAAIAGVAMTFYGAMNMQWSSQIVVLTALAAAAFMSLIVIAIRLTVFSRMPKHPEQKRETVAHVEFIADIDASVAFFDILENSDWSREQRPIEHPISDWLSRRLDDEIHNRLLQGRLRAWGREYLTPCDEAPEDVIPKEKWAKIEIDFSDRPRTCASWRIKRNGTRVTAYGGIKFCKREIYDAFPPTDEEISLFEAATITYERIRNHESSIPMEVFADSSDAILANICETLTKYRDGHEPLLKIFGNKPPATAKCRERIFTDALNSWEFVVEEKNILFREPHGHFHYENIVVKAQRVEEAIQKLMERHE